MDRSCRVRAAMLAGCLLVARAGAAQEMVMPTPGPEHAVLSADVGTWDAVVEMFPAPGAPAMTSKGIEVNTLMGGMWLVSDFKSEMMGAPFQGHGVTGYDLVKKKYVGTWVDTMSAGMTTLEATYDPVKKTMTGIMEGPDMSGKMMRMREVVERPDDQTRVFSMYAIGPDGKDTLSMRITYKKRP